MIIYDLNCHHGHSFEGWFHSAESFGQQAEAGLLTCPHCGSAEIQRVPSAVHLSKASVSPTPSGKQNELAPEEKLLLLKQVISTLIANSEDVGRDFVREVRRIHYLESPQRAIRGEASREEFEELQDEGIDVLMLPSGLKNEFH